MKFIASLLLIATPVAAQSIDPATYGQFYCNLRTAGVDVDTARRAAIQAAWQQSAPASRRESDIRASADYVAMHCQQYAGT